MNSSVVQHSDPAPPTIKTPVCCLEALCKFCINLEASLGQPIITSPYKEGGSAFGILRFPIDWAFLTRKGKFEMRGIQKRTV